MTTVRRLDRGEYRKATRTPEGWLKADGYFSRIGVFSYAQPDGTVIRELRHPDEVFKPESVQTFAQVPVTDGHPPEFLDGENTDKYAIGSTGETIRRDSDFMVGAITVWKKSSVSKVDSGEKQELSLGYLCDLDFTPGTWVDPAGTPHRYDAVQRNIRGNHCAIVEKGRAGPKARIRLDAKDAVQQEDAAPGGGKTPEEKEPTVIKKNIDGVDAEVSEAASQLIDRAKAKADAALAEAKAKADAAEAEAQKLKAKADALADDLKKKQDALTEATDPKKVQAAISARVDLETKAKAVLGTDAKLDALDARGVQIAVLAKLLPELKLDGQPDAYVQGRFDMAIDSVGKDALAKVRSAIVGNTTTTTTSTGHVDEMQKAHQEMVARNAARWKPAKSA